MDETTRDGWHPASRRGATPAPHTSLLAWDRKTGSGRAPREAAKPRPAAATLPKEGAEHKAHLLDPGKT